MIVATKSTNTIRPRKESTDMELLTIVTALVSGLIVIGILAVSNGADSRDAMTDDWARPARI
jgi:hypothetical protein